MLVATMGLPLTLIDDSQRSHTNTLLRVDIIAVEGQK